MPGFLWVFGVGGDGFLLRSRLGRPPRHPPYAPLSGTTNVHVCAVPLSSDVLVLRAAFDWLFLKKSDEST